MYEYTYVYMYECISLYPRIELYLSANYLCDESGIKNFGFNGEGA